MGAPDKRDFSCARDGGGGIRARKTRKELLRVEIKEDLLDQLARNGTTGKYYIDLVDKYMDFWDLENELIADIKAQGDFCIGGACYPEGHPEAATIFEDLDHLKEKVDAGCEFLTTQMFFDNNILYNFMYKALKKGIDVPIVAGIMPVTNASQIKRITSLSGNMVPPRFLAIVDRFGDNPAAMRQAGIAYATEQIIDLIANGKVKVEGHRVTIES